MGFGNPEPLVCVDIGAQLDQRPPALAKILKSQHATQFTI